MQIPAYMGTIADIIVILILIFSFIGGLKSGVVKEFFGLLSFIIAIPLGGILSHFVVSWFSFIGDSTWRYFLAFMLTMFVIIIILQILFWAPRHLLEKVWNGGFFFSFLGGVLGILNSALGLVFLICLFNVYPVLPWLNSVFALSGVLNWLVSAFGAFIQALLNSTNLAGLTASISFFSA
ncbi:MAG: CvpA family protein [Dehalococcoidia bacterium]|nr:CvpA family protein [Dehalococcoidia bacterium]